MKKFLSVLSLALCLALCLGMAAPALAEETAFPRNDQGYPDLGGSEFEIWYYNRQPNVAEDLGEMEVVKKLEELFNCDIQFVHPPQGQESEHFAIVMAGDTLPDMFYCNAIDNFYPGGVAMAYEDGILFDYTEYVNETNTPNFVKLILNDDFLSPMVKDDSNRVIRLGAKMQGSADADFWYEGLAVRASYLADTGMEMPETIGEWYDVLTAMKANGVEFPLLLNSGYNLQYFAFAYGINSKDYYADKGGKVHYGPYEDAYKDYLTEMNKWYSEGLINQDYMNLGDNDQMAMLSGDRAGAVAWHYWNWCFPYYQNTESQDPDKAMLGAQLPKLNKEDELTNLRYSSRNFDDFKYITADAKDPLACVYLLDALYYPEISNMMGLGIEGVAWEMVDGQPVNFNLAEDDANKLSKGITEWHTYEDTDPVNILQYKYCNGDVPNALRLVAQCATDGRVNQKFLMYTTEEAEVRSSHNTDLRTYVNEMQLKFITGQTSLDEFEAYQEQLRALGVEEMIEVTQAAYDRMQARR